MSTPPYFRRVRTGRFPYLTQPTAPGSVPSRVTSRQAVISGAALAALTALSVLVVDGPVAAMIAPYAAANRTLVNPIVHALEIVFLFPVSKFAFGGLILLAAIVLFPFARWRAAARLLLFVSLSQLTTRLIAGVLKNVFLRERPLDGRFFVDGGSSFPSGHAAHFWGLFFALAIAFPRLRIPALVLAVLVSVARVIVNDHFIGDVVASAAIAALVTAAYTPLARKRMSAASSEAALIGS